VTKMNARKKLPVEFLPASVRELVDVVGVDAALAIVHERGGVRLCVPRYARTDHWLVTVVGIDALEALVEVYAGEEIDIPRCVDALRALREQQIYNDYIDGSTQAALARKYGYTERGIRKLLRRIGVQSAQEQLGLF